MTDRPQYGMVHPSFDALVQRIIQTVPQDKLAELRKDFHTRLRITLTQPDDSALIEDLWDFFYDWCMFEQHLPESMKVLPPNEQELWGRIQAVSTRGLYTVARANDSGLKLKELYTGKVALVPKKNTTDFLGIERGDILEARLVGNAEAGKTVSFVRRPSYHPVEVHGYIKKKVKQFRKSQDPATYQSWLWLLVGMYLKHRIYHHMPIDKIYDDNSRI